MLELLKKNSEIDQIFGLRFDSSFKSFYKDEIHLKSLFRDIFQENIESMLNFRSEEFSKENVNFRCCRCDLLAETNKYILLVEIQNKNIKDFKKRLKKYVSFLYTEQKCEEDYRNLKSVKVYLIINYGNGCSKVLKHFSELEHEVQEQFDDLSELKVFNLVDALKCEKESLEYKYARLFKLDKLKKENAIKILEEYSSDERLKDMVNQIILYNLDVESYRAMKEEIVMEESWELATSGIQAWGEAIGEKRGKKAGKKEGIKIGEKRGAKKATKELLGSLLEQGVPIELLAKAAKITEAQVKSYVRS